MRKRYQSIVPLSVGGFELEWHECFDQLKMIVSGSARVFKLSVFVDATDKRMLNHYTKQIIDDLHFGFGEKLPAVTVLSQSPEEPYKIAAEIGIVDTEGVKIQFKRHNGIFYSVIENNGYREIWASGIGLNSKAVNTYNSAIEAFEEMRSLLVSEGLGFDHIVRQWNYVPQILDFENDNEEKHQHYQVFNEVRNYYYNKYRTTKGFPAATGIGVANGSVSIDFCAVSSEKEIKAFSIQNPAQVNPYIYGQDVLEGSLVSGTVIKQAPQFERGKLLFAGNDSSLFISGTASIIGQNTIGIGDVAAQTEITIDHIEKISSIENLKFYAPGLIHAPLEIVFLRVYIKHQSDFACVKDICNRRFGDIAITYVQSDICRNNLLVEIECEMGNVSA